MVLLPDMYNGGLRMHRECRERLPRRVGEWSTFKVQTSFKTADNIERTGVAQTDERTYRMT